jgi:hypothetical protein
MGSHSAAVEGKIDLEAFISINASGNRGLNVI